MTIPRYILSWLNFDLIDRLPTEVGYGNCQQTQINSYTKNLAQFNSLRLRPCSHVSGYFRKRRLFSPFSKNIASTRSAFDSFWLVASIWNVNEKLGFQKSSLWGPFFKTCVFGARKRRLRVDGSLQPRKTSPFSKYPDTYGRGLSSWSQDL